MLFEVCLCHLERSGNTLEFLLEDLEDLGRFELFVHMVGNVLGGVAHSLAHLGRQIQAEILLQNIADAALSGLTVDTDNVCLVLSSDILWIQRKIGNSPFSGVPMLVPDLHALGNGILMRTGEGCK